MDGILLAALAATSQKPELYALSEETLSAPEPYGLVFRRNDPAFKAAVNESLRHIFTGRIFTASTRNGSRKPFLRTA